MQERKTNISQQDDSARSQRLVTYLDTLWRSSDAFSPEMLKKMTRCAVGLSSPYNSVALQMLAEHLINRVDLHFLATLTLFLEMGEREGITPEEQEGTCGDILPLWQKLMAESGKHIRIDALDDLVNLAQITVGLCGLYHADSAEEAQRVLYELPQIYHDQLVQKGLLPPRSTLGKGFELLK